MADHSSVLDTGDDEDSKWFVYHIRKEGTENTGVNDILAVPILPQDNAKESSKKEMAGYQHDGSELFVVRVRISCTILRELVYGDPLYSPILITSIFRPRLSSAEQSRSF